MTDSQTYPVLALRDAVLFPGVTVPIGAGRAKTLKAIEAAMAREDDLIFVVAQRQNEEEVSPELLYSMGTVAKVAELQRGLGGVQLLLHGEHRGIAIRLREEDGYLQAVVRQADEMMPLNAEEPAFVGLYREVRERAAELGKRAGLPDEVIGRVLQTADGPGRFADLVAAYTEMSTAEKQMILETLPVEERLRRVLVQMQRQIGVLEAQETIKSQVQEELGDRQREIYLREQLKAIQRELGEGDDGSDLEELRDKLLALDLPEAARKEVDRELGRLARTGRESMESQVIRNFLENVAELPWNARSEEHLDIQEAARILEEDHYGLEDVKDRVLEFLAVRQLARQDEERAEAEAVRQAGEAVGESAETAAGEAGVEPGGEPSAAAEAAADDGSESNGELPPLKAIDETGGASATDARRTPRRTPPRTRRTARPRCRATRTTGWPRGRSCSSSARRASARPRSPSRSPAPWAASTCASRWAAPATRRTSAATGAPTSVPCPGASCRA